MKKVLVLVAACLLVVSCEKEKSDVYSDGKASTSEVMQKDVPNPNTPIKIVTIRRGEKKGNWPQQYCKGRTGWCWLWFQDPDQPHISDAEVLAKLKTNSLQLTVNYSSSSEEDKPYWAEDVENGYVEISSDIIMDDTTYFANPIVIPTGQYPISNVEGESYEVELPYQAYVE